MIKISGLSKKFDGKLVIDDLNAELKPGRITTIMGSSGCGKTTLAMILMGLTQADGGHISGLEKKKVSAVFQEDRLVEHLSAIDNIKMVINDHTSELEIERELAKVNLSGALITKPTSQLSGGQKRRVAIVRAMMADSDFICLDEPFKGLDDDTKFLVMEYVKENIEGKTTLFITHDGKEKAFFEGDYIGVIPGPVCDIWPF